MIRLSAIALLLSAPLFAQPALAQDCFCGAGGFWLVEAETPDTTIASTAFPAGAQPLADAGSRAPAGHAVLWCASANDPRCQPMQPSDAPTPRALAGGSVGATVSSEGRSRHRFATMMTMSPIFGLRPSGGVRSGLDRPPRR